MGTNSICIHRKCLQYLYKYRLGFICSQYSVIMSIRPFFDPLIDNVIEPLTTRIRSRFSTDIHETDNGWELEMEAPGFRKEELNIEIDGHDLVISGQHAQEEERPGRRTVFREREVSKVARRFTLPANSDPSKIRCKMEHGLLRVSIPKSESGGSRKRLQIE
ncbi:hypothetical protein GEMRC1_006685 [Eukaryota sp. GEM-RC1]